MCCVQTSNQGRLYSKPGRATVILLVSEGRHIVATLVVWCKLVPGSARVSPTKTTDAIDFKLGTKLHVGNVSKTNKEITEKGRELGHVTP